MSAAKTPTIKRSSRQNHAPGYDEGTRAKLLRFLAAYLTEAETTLCQTKAMAGEDRHLPMIANKIRYHENQVSTIKWLVSKVYNRQRHLLEMSDDEISEVVRLCVEPFKT